MNHHDHPADVADELADALHSAAGAVPPYSGELAAAQRRGRAHRRHRTVTVAGFTALAVAAALGLPFALTGADPGSEAEPPVAALPGSAAASTAPGEPAQRLLLDGDGWVNMASAGEDSPEPPVGVSARESYEWYRDQPDATGVLGPIAEVLPDGDVAELDLDLPGVDSVRDMVALPDGRLVVIGLHDRTPGAEREDGPCVEGLDFPLLVVAADGSVSQSRQARVMCETLELLGADADTAYLVRGSRLVAHDLATGDERELLDAPEVSEVAWHGSIAGGRVVAVDDQLTAACASGEVLVADLAAGAWTDYPLPGEDCVDWAGPVQLSPDGRHVAAAFVSIGDGRSDLRVAVIDLTSGAVVLEHNLVGTDHENATGLTIRGGAAAPGGHIAGLAWDDRQTLRVAWYEVPREGVRWLPDLIQVDTLAVPGD
jgi:hypothetical protein